MTTTTATIAARTGRRCVTCSHPAREQIEQMAATGQRSIRGIASQFEISPESLRRHLRAHSRPEIQRALEGGTPGFSAVAVAAQILGVIQQAQEISRDALERGEDALALRAGRAQVAALSVMADRLGVVSGDALAGLSEADELIRGVLRAMRRDPDLGEVIASALDDDEGTLAVALRQRADTYRNQQMEISA